MLAMISQDLGGGRVRLGPRRLQRLRQRRLQQFKLPGAVSPGESHGFYREKPGKTGKNGGFSRFLHVFTMKTWRNPW